MTDEGVLRTGLLALPKLSLEQESMTPPVFSDVLADPTEAVVLNAVDTARHHEADLVLGFGGGSFMDVAKLVAVLAGSRQAIREMYGIGKVSGQRRPLVQVPNTAGTGPEVTDIAIVTAGATTKSGIVAPQLYADLAILDAALTLGLPPTVTAATGIDAMVHAIDTYTSRQKKNPLSDALAREALSLLSRNLLRACEQGGDIEARQAMLLGACLAGQAFSNAPVAAVHALAYPIGSIFHVPHGLSNSLVLPPCAALQPAAGESLVCRTGEHCRTSCERERRGACGSTHCCDATNSKEDRDRNELASGRHHERRPRPSRGRCHAADQTARQ